MAVHLVSKTASLFADAVPMRDSHIVEANLGRG